MNDVNGTSDGVDLNHSEPNHTNNSGTPEPESNVENCNGILPPDPIPNLGNQPTNIETLVDNNTNQLVKEGCEVPQEENEGFGLNLKEWGSMDHLLSKIPMKAQKGLNTFEHASGMGYCTWHSVILCHAPNHLSLLGGEQPHR
jgi:hypothetical protein